MLSGAAWNLLRGAHGAIALNIFVVRLYVLLAAPDAPQRYPYGTLFGIVRDEPLSPTAFGWLEVFTVSLWMLCVRATAPAARRDLFGERAAGTLF